MRCIANLLLLVTVSAVSNLSGLWETKQFCLLLQMSFSGVVQPYYGKLHCIKKLSMLYTQHLTEFVFY